MFFKMKETVPPPKNGGYQKGGNVRFTCLVGLEVVLDVDGLALLVHVLEGVRPVPVICMYRDCGVAIKISRSASLVRVRHTGTHTHAHMYTYIFILKYTNATTLQSIHFFAVYNNHAPVHEAVAVGRAAVREEERHLMQ